MELKSQGLGYGDVVASTVYLGNRDDLSRMNAVYAKYFQAAPPARTTVAVSRLPFDARVEISIVAAR